MDTKVNKDACAGLATLLNVLLHILHCSAQGFGSIISATVAARSSILLCLASPAGEPLRKQIPLKPFFAADAFPETSETPGAQLTKTIAWVSPRVF